MNSPETPIFRKSAVLYGFDKAAGPIAKSTNHEVIVCEGQIDCIRLQTCGFPNAVAGQGTAFTEEHVRMLGKIADQVALVYDDDAAGHKATIRSARLCLAAGLPVRVVSLPDGDDPDSFLRAHPPEDFRRLLDDAASIMSFQARAARAAERNPDSVDAVNRIAHELLATVVVCPNAVLRAGMLGEAARIMGLPSAALAAELERLMSSAPQPRRPAAVEPAEQTTETAGDDSEETIVGEDASVAEPPPSEMALCALLMENEHDRTLDETIRNFLPPQVFASDFTARFVTAWRGEIVDGNDHIQAFAESLGAREHSWFDRILIEGGKAQASELSAFDNLRNFVRTLWMAAMRRRRGSLPATGGPEVEMERLRLSVAAKRLASVKWHSAKEMILEEIRRWNG